MTGPAATELELKRDHFGAVFLVHDAAGQRQHVCRDTRLARTWAKPLARWLARREARALDRLAGLDAVPRLIGYRAGVLTRGWIDGAPMQHARPTDPAYYRAALHLLRRLHARRVVHNDLAKEPNWLVTTAGGPALVDFQLAWTVRRRGRLFRALAHDDLRHLLKHKRSYLPARLTARERRILATPSLLSRLWMRTGKRLYLFITRRVFHWADREGAGDRRF
ncbi:MAG: serine/threonine protein kinase [Steroidobacteraceae bacterium]